MQERIKGLLFDKDGTLFDFHHTWSVWCHGFITGLAASDEAIARRLADRLDFDLERRAFHPSSPVIAGTLEVLVDAVTAVLDGHDPRDIRQGIIDTSAAAKMVQAVPLVPLLDGFRARGLVLGVATNDAEHPCRIQLETEGVLGHFDFIAGYDSGYGEKPEPGMLLAFCEAVGLEPEQVAMIGDSTHDLHSGAAAGMVRVGVLTGPALHDDLKEHADVILPDIGHLPAWLGLEQAAGR